MLLLVRLLSALAAALQLAGLLLRVVVVGLFGAIALRLAGLVEPQLLPSFWLMLLAALIVVAPAAWSGGHDEARRAVRDAAIRKAEREYREGWETGDRSAPPR